MPSLWEALFGSVNTTEILSGSREPMWRDFPMIASIDPAEIKQETSIIVENKIPRLKLTVKGGASTYSAKYTLEGLDIYIAELIGWRDKLAKLTDKE